MIPVVPFLCVTAAYLVCWGVSEAVARLQTRREPSAFVPAIATALVALAIVWTGAARTLAFDRIMAKTDSRVLVADWFEKNVPPGSTVVQSGSVYGRARFPGALGYREWRWDGGRRVFLLGNKRLSAKDAPEWIVMQDSPLPSGNQEILTDLVKDRYELVSAIPGLFGVERSRLRSAGHVLRAVLGIRARRPAGTELLGVQAEGCRH